MSNRQKKDYLNVSMRLDRKTWEDLKTYADEMGQTYTVATERILRQFLAQHTPVADSTTSFYHNS